MNRIYLLIAAAALWLTAGCSDSASSDRYIGTSASQQNAGESASPFAGAEADAPSGEASSTSTPDGGKQAADSGPPPSPSAVKANEGPRKPSPPPAKEVQKNNESVSRAVTGSILNKDGEQKDAGSPKDEKLADSVERIRTQIKDLKQLAENGDEEQSKALASQIVQTWAAMETDVKASYPDTAAFIQEKINAVNELQNGDPLDLQALLRLDYELYQAFRQLADQIGG